MRTQMTVYLHTDSKRWLKGYSRRCRLKESEIVRILLEREQQIKWLQWALQTPDPAIAPPENLPSSAERLPPRWNVPPKLTRARRGANQPR
jgi:hypothetical protein